MKASNLSEAEWYDNILLDIHVGRPCLVHAGILLLSTTQCL
jgi:hypothetical protein